MYETDLKTKSIEHEHAHAAFKADVFNTVVGHYPLLDIAEMLESLETIKQILAEIEANNKEQN